MQTLKIADTGARVQARHTRWHHLPSAEFERQRDCARVSTCWSIVKAVLAARVRLRRS